MYNPAIAKKMKELGKPYIPYKLRTITQGCFWVGNEENGRTFSALSEIKPILRPLSDITEAEAKAVTEFTGSYGDTPGQRTYKTWKNQFGKIVVSWGQGLREKYVPQDETIYKPEQFTYLLKQGFDLFGLIESGLAINKTISNATNQR